MEVKMVQKLKGVPETLLIPLWAKATETKRSKPIIKDEKALEIMEQIDYDSPNLMIKNPHRLVLLLEQNF